jgi:alanine racemase
MRATRAIIHLDKFYHNLRLVREKIGPACGFCVPVKADAYGHGAVRIAEAALNAGARYLAVASVGEGAELREAGIDAPILLFSQPLREELPDIAALNLSLFISDKEFAVEASRTAEEAGKVFPVHIKIDTGMGRMGCRPEEAADLAAAVAACKGLHCTGTATHLAAADSLGEEDFRYTQKQLALFREAVESIKNAGFDPGVVHAANSGALVLHKDSYFDMVRPGILLYGYTPAAGTVFALPAEPVMELVTRIVFIKEVKKGESVSYGRTWIAPENTVAAVLPVGYGDGLPRNLSGNFSVLIQGIPYPLAGRICMDQCMVNLGPNPRIRRWEEVIIFGGQRGAHSAADIAAKLNTIPYEITCNINKRVPRVYELKNYFIIRQ